MNLDQIVSSLRASGRYTVYDVYKYTPQYNDPTGKSNLRIGSVLDTETSGSNPDVDDIWNIGIVNFRFDDEGNIYDIVDAYKGYSEISQTIPDFILRSSKMESQDELKGCVFDKEKINSLLAQSEIIIAHNAKFDREFVDRAFPISQDKIWGCTLNQIPWWMTKTESVRQTDIARYLGFEYNTHRAIQDALALLHILSKGLIVGDPNSQTILKHIIDTIDVEYLRLDAVNSHFHLKDLLKDNNYHWDNKAKSWYKLVHPNSVMEEVEFLATKIYAGKDPEFTATEIKRVKLYSDK